MFPWNSLLFLFDIKLWIPKSGSFLCHIPSKKMQNKVFRAVLFDFWEFTHRISEIEESFNREGENILNPCLGHVYSLVSLCCFLRETVLLPTVLKQLKWRHISLLSVLHLAGISLSDNDHGAWIILFLKFISILGWTSTLAFHSLMVPLHKGLFFCCAA